MPLGDCLDRRRTRLETCDEREHSRSVGSVARRGAAAQCARAAGLARGADAGVPRSHRCRDVDRRAGRYLHFLRHSWVAIAVLDVPNVYAFQRAAMRQVPEHALLIAAMTVAIYLLLVMAVQLSISRSYLGLTARTSYALLVTLFAPLPGASRTGWGDGPPPVPAA